MVRWGWLAALLLCVAAQAGERDASDNGGTAASDVSVAASTNACSHAYTAPIADTALPASSLTRPQGRVTDLTGALSEACKADLTARLAALEQQTGDQLAVLLVPGSGSDTIEQYATKIFEQWKLGHKQVDNGILLVAALHDHHVRIEVGYGLESTIPDVVAGRIIHELVVPAFREQNYESGISAAVDELTQKLGGRVSSNAPSDAATPPQPDEATRATPSIAPSPPPEDHAGRPLFWCTFALLNVAFGAVAAWRKMTWGYRLGGSYVVTALAALFFASPGILGPGLQGAGGTLLLPALLLPAIFSWPLVGLGHGLFVSKKVRQYTGVSFGALCVSVLVGCAMGYSFVGVLLVMTLFVTVTALIVAWLEATMRFARGGSHTDSSTGTSFGTGWISSSDSDTSSSSSSGSDWSGGDGGSSGGGGASDSW
ncbi:TPM domain-containing protein [Paraburkholderia bannensis]|uniref:TPM domain-containing protein n=1 Tax=Paraburkholderia bannensis TaxID=765414 RepID=UPI002AB6D0B7|nr:TPM domain-containing protein [Paraburkholderia bannensis]